MWHRYIYMYIICVLYLHGAKLVEIEIACQLGAMPFYKRAGQPSFYLISSSSRVSCLFMTLFLQITILYTLLMYICIATFSYLVIVLSLNSPNHICIIQPILQTLGGNGGNISAALLQPFQIIFGKVNILLSVSEDLPNKIASHVT